MPSLYSHTLTVPSSAIDELGHVNNVTYVSWLQDAATAHSVAQGWDLSRYQGVGGGWVVGSHYIEYVRPAFEGEDLTVLTWVASMEPRRSLRRYRIVRGEKQIVRAETMWVFVDLRTGRPKAIPREVAGSFTALGADWEP